MAEYYLTKTAKADIASILKTSESRHGLEARLRYRGLIAAAIRRVADDPNGPLTKEFPFGESGVRSFHIRHSRRGSGEGRVGHPVHVIFYRAVHPGLIEIVRVLHERMEPTLHIRLVP